MDPNNLGRTPGGLRTDLDRLGWTWTPGGLEPGRPDRPGQTLIDLDGPAPDGLGRTYSCTTPHGRPGLDGPGRIGRTWTDLDGSWRTRPEHMRACDHRIVRSVRACDPPREAFLINPRIKPLAHRDHDRDRIFSIA